MDTKQAAEQLRLVYGITVDPSAIGEQLATMEANARLAAELAGAIDFEAEPADYLSELDRQAPVR
ncbi:MAG: hypothetical protein RJQ21_18400 [Rhodospirillales bacterium]